MNPQKQLFRQPIRTLVMLLLLCVASAFLCLGFGVLRSSEETLKTIKNQFVTVIFPNFTQHRVTEPDGLTTFIEDYSEKDQAAILKTVRESAFSKGNSHQNYISAYSPDLSPITTVQEGGHYDNSLEQPYGRAILAITITELEYQERERIWGSNLYVVTAHVDEVIALHHSYTCRETIHFDYWENGNGGRFSYTDVPLEVGGRYWIYGDGYMDRESTLKDWIARNIGCGIDEVDWKYVIENPYKNEPDYPFDREAPWYCDDKDRMISLTTNQLAQIGQCDLGLLEDMRAIEVTQLPEYETPEEEEKAKEAEKAKWEGYQEALEKQYHTVPVLGTDLLEGIYLFHEKKAFVTQGRSFEKEDYEKGNPVCLISETLAAYSGLSVGDTIDLSFYLGRGGINRFGNDNDATANPMARVLQPGEKFLEEKTYEIIGVYRQENLWGYEVFDMTGESITKSSSYSFTPNTVFVPNASLEGLPTYTSDSGIYSTMVLKNGSIEEMKAALEAAGYSPDALTYFDGGYSELVGTLNSFRESAGQLFLASVLTWLAAAVVYLALFVLRQRRNAGLMVSLGSGRRKATGFVWTISMLPVLAASAVGALVGMALMNGTLEKVFASVQDVLSSEFSSTAGGHISVESTLVALPWTAALAALGQGLIFAALIWLCAAAITRRKPLDNLKGT